MRRRILLTGFKPFGDDTINPSGEIARFLDGLEIGGYAVVSKVLPVEWGTASDIVRSLIEESPPALVLSLGLAAGRVDLGVEKVAINLCAQSKDNAGKLPESERIVPGGFDAHFSTLPVERIVEFLTSAGVPASRSLSAGAYLCNYIFYSVIDYMEKTGRPTPSGFIHLPATPEMVVGKSRSIPSMCMEVMRKGIELALTAAVADLTNSG